MITFRSATLSDFEWTYLVKKKALGDYVVATWGAWYEDLQKSFFSQTFREGDYQVIEYEHIPVGTIWVDRRPDELFLAELYLLPAYQNKGIGSQIICDLKAEARQRQIPFRLTVLQINHSARRFYERHGLTCTEELTNHYVMTYHG
ncbi:MAG: GNAT family N-acetyltransferase [Siphonobacter sp.]